MKIFSFYANVFNHSGSRTAREIEARRYCSRFVVPVEP